MTRSQLVILSRRSEHVPFYLYHFKRCPPQAVTGKEILFGYDIYGRPAFYMIPSRQNTNEATRQIEFAVWMLERAIDLMDEDVE
jgi:hypothetical protein